MRQTKLMIQKKKFWSSGFSRWYSVGNVLLDDFTYIKTEAQFCLWLLRSYGEGRFMIRAVRKGRKGFWIFFIGDIGLNGFKRDRKNNVWIDRLPEDKLGVYPDEYYQDEYTKEEHKQQLIRKKKHRPRNLYGLIPSQPVGHVHQFQEYDPNLINK